MNNAQLQRITDAQTAIAKKVLDAVAINEAWSINQIINELYRNSRARYDKNILMGVLDSLKESGLIREPRPGCFQRIAGKPFRIIESVVPIKEVLMPAQPKTTLLSKFEAVANDLRELADRIDTLAIEVGEVSAEDAKYKQLADLLKSLK